MFDQQIYPIDNWDGIIENAFSLLSNFGFWSTLNCFKIANTVWTIPAWMKSNPNDVPPHTDRPRLITEIHQGYFQHEQGQDCTGKQNEMNLKSIQIRIPKSFTSHFGQYLQKLYLLMIPFLSMLVHLEKHYKWKSKDLLLRVSLCKTMSIKTVNLLKSKHFYIKENAQNSKKTLTKRSTIQLKQCFFRVFSLQNEW